jgi:DNA-binding CsgD family transcriptional regulator
LDAATFAWQESFIKDAGLTAREVGIMHSVIKGVARLDIANELGIDPETIKVHRKNAYRKLGIHSREELIDKVASITDAAGVHNGNK